MEEPFDIDKLSPEDRALFDAMVQEEMMKLEQDFKREAVSEGYTVPSDDDRGYMGAYDGHEREDRDVYEKRDKFEDKYDKYEDKERYGGKYTDRVRDTQHPSPNSLNPNRLAYNNALGVNGVGMNFGQSEDTHTTKVSKQREYARQLQQDQQQGGGSIPVGGSRRSASANVRRHQAQSGRGAAPADDSDIVVLASSRSQGAGVGGRRGGRMSEVEERRAKIEKQKQYARELEEQMQEQKAQVRESPPRHPSSRRPSSPPMSSPFGAGQPSARDLKLRKQQEYARQLEQDKAARECGGADSRRNSDARVHHDPHARHPSSRRPPDSPSMSSPFGAGKLATRDLKQMKQQEYARQLELDKMARDSSRNEIASERRQSGGRRAGESVSDQYNHKSPHSSRRTSSPPMSSPFGAGKLATRDLKQMKQQEYARQLEQDMLARDSSRRDGVDSRRNNDAYAQHDTYERRPSRRTSSPPMSSPFGAGKLATRDLKQMKQQEYARQLEQDMLARDSSRHDGVDNRRNNDAYAQHDTYERRPSRRTSSPPMSSPFGAGKLATRDLKQMKQQEYARQLELDKMARDSSRNEIDGGRTPTNMRAARHRALHEDDSSGAYFGPGGGKETDRATKRREQEEYARQIREASSKAEITSPRHSISNRRKRDHDQQQQGGSMTSLALPGGDVNTAVLRRNKREQQERYREALDECAHAAPVDSSRAPLRQRDRGEGDVGGFTPAGLIGHHETESERRNRKKESQRQYYEDLSREQKQQLDPRDLAHPSPMQHRVSPITTKERPPAYQDQEQRHYEERYSEPRYGMQPSASELLAEDPEEAEYLKMLKEKAARRVGVGIADRQHREYEQEAHYEHGNRGHQQHPKSVPRGYEEQYPGPYERNDYTTHHQQPSKQEIDHDRVRFREQQPVRPEPAAADPSHRYQQPSTSQCTGLVIGGMTVLTAAERAEKQRQQRQYAIDVAAAKEQKPVSLERESWAERNRYKGNGLPGEYKGDSSVMRRHDDLEPGSEGHHRMQRRGKQEEYAAQLQQQIQDKRSRAPYY